MKRVSDYHINMDFTNPKQFSWCDLRLIRTIPVFSQIMKQPPLQPND